MKVFQWILTVLGVFYGLILLIGGSFVPFLIALIALVVIAPPIQPQIEQRLPWLRSKFLKLFLCVILWFVSLMFNTGNLVSLSDIAVCTSPVDGQCEQHNIAVLENTSSLTVSAKFLQGDMAEQVSITLDYWPEPEQESEVYSQTFDVPEGQEQVLFTLDELELQPGNYSIKLTPEGVGKKDALTGDRRFSVWTDSADVENRNGGELDNAGFQNSVSEVKICENDGETEDPCQENQAELSTNAQGIAFTAEIPSLKVNRTRLRGDSEITFLLRYFFATESGSAEPEQLFRETSELDREVGTYTLYIEAPDGGFLPGDYELITSLETRSSMPIRKLFTFK